MSLCARQCQPGAPSLGQLLGGARTGLCYPTHHPPCHPPPSHPVPASRSCPDVAALVVLSFPSLEVVYEDLLEVQLDVPYCAGYLGFRCA